MSQTPGPGAPPPGGQPPGPWGQQPPPPPPPGGQPPPPPGGPPPAGGPPGWPPGPTQPPPGGGNKGLIIALVAVALVVVGGGLFFVSSSDDDNGGGDGTTLGNGSDDTGSQSGSSDSAWAEGGPESEAEQTVRSFMDAEERGDCESALGLLTPDGLQQGFGTSVLEDALDQCRTHVQNEQTQGIRRERDVHGVETDISGNEATVTITMTATVTDGTNEQTQTFRQMIDLVNDGGWRIDVLGSPEPAEAP